MATEWLLQRNASGDNQIVEFHVETVWEIKIKVTL
jgi:hypothetical protein